MSQNAFRQFSLIGSGRVARHLAFYLESLKIPFVTWSRREDPSLAHLPTAVEKASHVLLAVSDSALEAVAGPLRGSGRTLVHFSGAVTVPGVVSAHPLMTFGDDFYREDDYRRIAFVIDSGHTLAELLPGLPNPSFALSPKDKNLYHALCVLAGNSTHLLWRRIGEEFSALGLSPEVLKPYLNQVVENALTGGGRGFTGPVAREDWSVVRGHLRELAGRADLLDSYRSFLRLAHATGLNLPKDLV